MFKVAPRVEKIFCELHNEKILVSIMDGRNSVFPYFYRGIIFYSVELFDCPVNFKFYFNIFIFLNINTSQTLKGQYLN